MVKDMLREQAENEQKGDGDQSNSAEMQGVTQDSWKLVWDITNRIKNNFSQNEYLNEQSFL